MRQATQPSTQHAQRELALLGVLNEVIQTLHRTHTLNQIAIITVDALKKYSQSPMVAFYILPPHQQHLELVAQYGFSDLAQNAGAHLPLQGSLSGVTIARRDLVVSDDLVNDDRTEPTVQQALAARGLKSVISIPLVFDDDALGVANLVFDQKIALDDAQRETFLSVGKIVGLSIANARHLEQLHAEIAERRSAEASVRELNRGLEQHVAERTAELQLRSHQLEAALNELESITYTISHDLRTPLRAINGFGKIVQLDYGHLMDPQAHDYLQRIRDAAQQMGELIDSLLTLSRLTRHPIKHSEVNLSKIASQVIDQLRSAEPARVVKITIAPRVIVHADPLLMSSVMEHLLGNAWKFSSRTENAQIEFGVSDAIDFQTYFVRDNGVGFDMQYVKKLFGTFQRLHHADEFPGIGVGLAVVQRILQRHGGRIWAESEPGRGATFYFTLGEKP